MDLLWIYNKPYCRYIVRFKFNREKNHTVCFCLRTYRSLASKLKNVLANGDSVAKVYIEGWIPKSKDMFSAWCFAYFWQSGNLSLFITEVLAMMLKHQETSKLEFSDLHVRYSA